jgi:hypothetical protein
MSLPRTVAEVLSQHVTLEVEGIDRMYLNVYQPTLQTDRGVAAFFRFHRGETFASSALMDPMSKSFITAPISPTMPSSASTVMNTSNANWPRKGLLSRLWTTAS